MTFEEFTAKYNGKLVDVDGFPKNNPYQCMDLYRKYVSDVLAFPQSSAVPGAKDVWGTYLSQYFTRYSNTPLGIPQKGDIVIWGTGYGPFGHIAIIQSAGLMNFTSFDQNDPLGTSCHFQKHNYNGVLGWLRPKTFKLTEEQKNQKVREIFGKPISVVEQNKQAKDVLNG